MRYEEMGGVKSDLKGFLQQYWGLYSGPTAC
jgi:hypothetical protein